MTLMLRRLGLLVIAATVVAVVLAKLDPPATHWRLRQPAGWVGLRNYCLPDWDQTPTLLEVGTGRVKSIPLPDGDHLDVMSCSPWQGDDGRVQVVGRWARRVSDGPSVLNEEFGLARCTFPDGEVLDRIPLEIMPSGPPCWFPGTQASVLFAAGDGKLYRLDFEPERNRVPAAEARRAVPLEWRCKLPEQGDPYIIDPCWPDDPRMAHCLLVSLRIQPRSQSRARAREQLWWLKLNDAGTAIVAAGRLIGPESEKGTRSRNVAEERFPAAAPLPDGRLAVAYLAHRRGTGWRLRMVPIAFDADQDMKPASPDDVKTLARNCLPTPPGFSADGRLLGIMQASEGHNRIVRIPVGGPPPSATAHRTARTRPHAHS